MFPRLLCRAVLLVLLLAAHSLAQQNDGGITVTSRLTPSTVGTGHAAVFAIRLSGAARADALPTVEVPGLDIQGPMNSVQQIVENGRVSVFVEYLFQLEAEKPGEYQIPAVELKVGGQVYKTQPQVLKVVEGVPIPPEYVPKLKLETAKPECWEGEILPLTISLWVHQDINLTELPMPQVPRDNFAMKRFQRNPDQDIKETATGVFRVFNYRTTINPLKSGDLQLGPAEMKIEALIPDGTGRRDPFGGMAARRQTFRVASEPLSIKVKPLPEAGKPVNFSGAIGSFLLQVQAQPTKLMVDDPIAVTLYVTGKGNFESLIAPALETEDGWRTYPAKQVQENRQSGLEPGAVAYSQVVMPEKPQSALPSYVLTFFNPEVGQYVTVKSDPIPLQVSPNPNRTAAATSGVRDFASTDKSVPTEDMKNVLTVVSAKQNWLSLTSGKTGGIPPWWIHAVGGAAVLALAGFGLSHHWRIRAGAKPASADLLPKAADVLRQLRAETGSLRKFYAAAAEFLEAWRREHGKPLPNTGPAAEAVTRIKMRRDFFCYGAAAPDQPVPESEHREILEALRQF